MKIKIYRSFSSNDLELAGNKLQQNCAELGYTLIFNVSSTGLRGKIKTRYDLIEFVLRYISTKTGISLGHYRIDVIKSENNYKTVQANSAQSAVQNFLEEVMFKTRSLCGESELEDEEQEIEERDVRINPINEPLQGGAPVPIDGFSEYW